MAKKIKVTEGVEHLRSNGKLKTRDYNDELAKLHVELVNLQQWVVHKGIKICIVFEGRDGAGKGGDNQGNHRACKPARVSRRRLAGSDRAREIADVHSAIHAVPPGRRGSRDIRPELVQPRRRRARHGLLHGGTDQDDSCRCAERGEGNGLSLVSSC